MTLRERFLKSYKNIPLAVRGDVVAVVDGVPLTYLMIYTIIAFEEKVDEALENMDKMKIL